MLAIVDWGWRGAAVGVVARVGSIAGGAGGGDGARAARARSASAQWRDLAFAAVLASAAWIASRQEPVDGKPMFGYLAALLLISASAFAIPALVSGMACGDGGHHAPRVRRRSAARHAQPGGIAAAHVGAGGRAVHRDRDAGRGGHHGGQLSRDRAALDGRSVASRSLPAARCARCADRHPTMSADIPAALAKLPEVAAVDQLRAYEISYQGLPATLGGVDARIAGRYGHRPFLSGTDPRTVFDQLIGSNTVIVSEPFANKHHIRAGDHLTLALGGKDVRFRVADIYYDYSNERGFIIMDRGTLLKYLPGDEPTNVAVYLKPGVPLETGRRAVEACAGRPEGRGGFQSHAAAGRHSGLRPDVRHHLRAGSGGGVRGDHGRGRRAAGAGDRPPPRVRTAAIPGRRGEPASAHHSCSRPGCWGCWPTSRA